MTECYAREYWLTNSGFHLEDSEFKAANTAAALSGQDLPSSLRICDVGCGAGGVLHHLAQLMTEEGHTLDAAVGYDISPPAIGRAREIFPAIQFEVGSAADIPPGWYVMLAMDVIEHLEDYHVFLRDLRGKSRLYVFHVPMELNVLRAIFQNELMEAWHNSAHIHHFCETTAVRALETTGLETVDRRLPDVDEQQGRTAVGPPGWRRRLVNGVRTALFRVAPDFTVAFFGDKSLLLVVRDRRYSAPWQSAAGARGGK